MLPEQVGRNKTRNRPILLIREINNMDDGTLLSCLSALETAKENLILFPIIMETSDSKWDATAPVKKSFFHLLGITWKKCHILKG